MKGQGKQMGLNKKNGTLKGVAVERYNHDKSEYEPTGAVGWVLAGNEFFIGVGERDGGYEAEIVLKEKTLRRMLEAVEDRKSPAY